MRFSILGPLEVIDDDGRVVQISRPLHRRALSLLLLRTGRAVRAADLIAALWAGQPPQRVSTSLRTCVYGLRQAMPDPARLHTHQHGYLITTRPGELDLPEFRDLAERGGTAMDRGDHAAAVTTLSAALRLWREPPLADLPAVPERDRLLEARNIAQEALLDARLALGKHRDVLADLRGLVAADPLREHLWAQLMLALYRCGARADALAAFGRARVCLVRTLGMEPGPELTDLHRKVLADAPELLLAAERPGIGPLARPARAADPPTGSLAAVAGQPARSSAPAAAQPSGSASGPAICQLPAPTSAFAGRSAELATLASRLTGHGMPVTVLTGMPGAGKTTLALQAAHQAAPRFPDGRLYAALSADGRPREPQEVLCDLLRGLGVPAGAIPAPGPERGALFRSVLARRRALIVADDARSADQVRPLLPDTAGSAVLVTSRSRLTGLAGAQVIELAGLTPDQCGWLLSAASGRPLTGPDHASAAAIAAACGYLPLAVQIAATRLARESDLTPAWLAALLADEFGCLNQLTVEDLSVRDRLAAAADPLARRALALLAVAGTTEISGWLATVLLGEDAADALLGALTDASLIHAATDGSPARTSYRLHRLVLGYGRELLADAGPGLLGSVTGRLAASGWLDLAGLGTHPAARPVGRSAGG
ncbi:MAG: AfsR/SARP family transcriptional regulator [Streptosporangiaceae bacterium]